MGREWRYKWDFDGTPGRKRQQVIPKHRQFSPLWESRLDRIANPQICACGIYRDN